MQNYTRIIGATSTNIRTPTTGEIGQGNDQLTPYDSAKNNGYYNEMSQAINNVSTEVTNAIIAAGITPGGALTQLTSAIQAITNTSLAALLGSSSLSSNGYARLPIKISGVIAEVIIQWGSFSAVGTSGSQAFPLTFPNQSFQVVGNDNSSSSATNRFATSSVAAGSFGWTAASGAIIRWMAIGN